jgi:hypothetical protein
MRCITAMAPSICSRSRLQAPLCPGLIHTVSIANLPKHTGPDLPKEFSGTD